MFQAAVEQHFVQELVWKRAPAALVGGDPAVADDALEAAHRFLFRNRGVGHPVQVPLEQTLLVVARELAVARQPLVVIVRDEVEEIFLEVGAGAGDRVHFVLADHLGQRHSELGGAHGAGDGHEHPAARVEVADVSVSRVLQRRRIEVAVVMVDKTGNRTRHWDYCSNAAAIILRVCRGRGHAPVRSVVT